MNREKTIFITQALGYNGNLLYWNKIFEGISEKNKNFRVFYPGPNVKLTDDLSLEKRVRLLRYKFNYGKSLYHYNLNLISPSFLYHVSKLKPKKIIISEFSIISFYVILYAFLFRSKVVLLIENDPKFVQKKHSLVRIIYRILITKGVDSIIVNNILGKKYCTDELNFNAKKIHVLPYLTSQIEGGSLNKTNDKLTFLFVGQISKRKGIYQIIKALDVVVNEKKNTNIELIVIGNGVELDNVKDLSSKINLKNHIRFKGNVDYDKLTVYFDEADVFINATLGDYRALIGFEALSKGLPMIYSKFDGACLEVVKNNKNGFIIDPNNLDEIVNGIVFFMENKESLNMFSQESKLISRKFSFRAITDNWTKIINL